MHAVKSLQDWIKANTKLKAEDVIVDALPGSTYLVSDNFASGDLKLFVGFIEQSKDASVFAELIYKWAKSCGRPLDKEIKFEALRINNNTWDYYFNFDWLDKTDLGEPGEKAVSCPIPIDPAQADAPPNEMQINGETVNTNLITHNGEAIKINDQNITYSSNE